jgi:hypothetical protein
MPHKQSQAKYIMMVPTHDNLGNHLGDLAYAGHQHLHKNAGISGSYVERGKTGFWEKDAPEEFDHLITYAPDSPEMDSHWKQLANHMAEAANQWGIFCVKEGEGGPQSWVVSNPHYQEGQPAPIVAAPQPGLGA